MYSLKILGSGMETTSSSCELFRELDEGCQTLAPGGLFVFLCPLWLITSARTNTASDKLGP